MLGRFAWLRQLRSDETRKVSIFLIAVCTSVLSTLYLPLAFGTNDDIALKALANGTYSGDFEYRLTFMSPIYGRLLELEYSALPSFDWYVFNLIFLQLISFGVLTKYLLRQENIALRVLAFAFGLFAFAKFFFPLQFTGAATVITLAAIFVLLDFRQSKNGHRLFFGLVLLLFGVAIRWEAGLLVFCLFAPTIALATLTTKEVNLQKLIARLILASMPLVAVLFANRWNSTAASTLHHSPIQRIQAIEESDRVIPGIPKPSIDLLLETRGMYFDRAAELSALSIEQDRSIVEGISDSLGPTLQILISRPYFAFILVLIALLTAHLVVQRFRLHPLLPLLGYQLLVFVTLLGYLNSAYERLPYRLLMPLWAALVLTFIFLLSTIQPIAVMGNQHARSHQRLERVRRVLTHRLVQLTAVGCGVIALALVGSTSRYLINYGARHDSVSDLLSMRTETTSCLSELTSMIFVIYPDDSLIPGGDLVPVASDNIMSFPVLDNGGLQHSAVFRKRIRYLGLEENESITKMMVQNRALIITSPTIASLLAALHTEATASDTVAATSVTQCGITAWQLGPASD